jgi:hypothetical protein
VEEMLVELASERDEWKQLAHELAEALNEKISMAGYAHPTHRMVLWKYQRAWQKNRQRTRTISRTA